MIPYPACLSFFCQEQEMSEKEDFCASVRREKKKARHSREIQLDYLQSMEQLEMENVKLYEALSYSKEIKSTIALNNARLKLLETQYTIKLVRLELEE